MYRDEIELKWVEIFRLANQVVMANVYVIHQIEDMPDYVMVFSYIK